MNDSISSPAPGGEIPVPAAPPAATVVITGTKTERELELERELDNERKARKDREVTLAHIQDENHRLKSAGIRPEPPTPPAPAKKSGGWTFFDED